MARSGIVLALTVFFAVFDYGLCVRCYQCNSQSDRDCMDPFAAASGRHLVDCSSSEALDYNRRYLRDVLPQQLVDASYVANAPRSCAKLVLQTGTTIRTCLDANPSDLYQTCRVIERAANDYPNSGKQVKHCSICDRDVCNGAGAITASLPIAFIALAASYLYYQ